MSSRRRAWRGRRDGLRGTSNGTIINIASSVALTPELLNGTYSGTKAYVVNFTQALHTELGAKHVRVHSRAPRCNANRLLGGRRLALKHLRGNRDVSRRDGRCRDERARPGGTDHDPRRSPTRASGMPSIRPAWRSAATCRVTTRRIATKSRPRNAQINPGREVAASIRATTRVARHVRRLRIHTRIHSRENGNEVTAEIDR